MTKHKNICTWLPAFAAEDLDQQRQNEFKEHLSVCSECRMAWAGMSQTLGKYKTGSRSKLPTNGLSRLQATMTNRSKKNLRRNQTFRYSTAAVLALILFSSGFWMGRNSADHPLTTVLHLPVDVNPPKDLPILPQLSFTVALAESIPTIFYPPNTIPH